VNALLRSGLAIAALGLSACSADRAAEEKEQRAVIAAESSGPALLNKARASTAMGDYSRAEQYYAAALRAGAPEKTVVERMIEVCVADQRYPAAVEHAEQYLYRHPGDAEVQFVAASLHVAIGELARGRSLYETVVKDRPNWPEPHYAFATLLRAEDCDIALADQHDLTYLKLSPQGAFAETARARLTRCNP